MKTMIKKHKIELLFILAALSILISYLIQLQLIQVEEVFPKNWFSEPNTEVSFSFKITNHDILSVIFRKAISTILVLLLLVIALKKWFKFNLNYKLELTHFILTVFSLLGIQLFNLYSYSINLFSSKIATPEIYFNEKIDIPSIKKENMLKIFEFEVFMDNIILLLIAIYILGQMMLIINVIKNWKNRNKSGDNVNQALGPK